METVQISGTSVAASFVEFSARAALSRPAGSGRPHIKDAPRLSSEAAESYLLSRQRPQKPFR